MLTDVEASAAQASDRDYKLADANGLYLFITRSGFKSWRMKYRFGGKEKRLTFGAYPEVSLSEARARRDEARTLLRDNIDPALEKQRLRAAATGEEPVSALGEDELPFQPNGYSGRQGLADESEDAVPKVGAPAPVVPLPATIRIVSPPPERPVSAQPGAASVPITSLDPVPNPPADTAPVELDTATGSRAVSLLKQAEMAAETAASQSRSAKRITVAVLALFGFMAVALGWWLLSHPRSAIAAGGGATVPLAAAHTPVMPASNVGSTSGTVPQSTASVAKIPQATSSHVSPAAGSSSGVVSPGASMRTFQNSGERVDAPTVARHLHRVHHRHRKHKKHRARHRHAHHSSRATANFSSTTGRTHAAGTTATSSAQETYHAIDVVAPRGAAIDPALDRAGRTALCLRAAYSASPGCTAVR